MGTHPTRYELARAEFADLVGEACECEPNEILCNGHAALADFDRMERANAELRAALGAFINAHNTAVKALYEDGTLCDCPYCKRARAALPAERDEKERQS